MVRIVRTGALLNGVAMSLRTEHYSPTPVHYKDRDLEDRKAKRRHAKKTERETHRSHKKGKMMNLKGGGK